MVQYPQRHTPSSQVGSHHPPVPSHLPLVLSFAHFRALGLECGLITSLTLCLLCQAVKCRCIVQWFGVGRFFELKIRENTRGWWRMVAGGGCEGGKMRVEQGGKDYEVQSSAVVEDCAAVGGGRWDCGGFVLDVATSSSSSMCSSPSLISGKGSVGEALTWSSGSSLTDLSSSFKSSVKSSVDRSSRGGEGKEERKGGEVSRGDEVMTGDPPDAGNSTEWLDSDRFEATGGGSERVGVVRSGKMSGKEMSSGDEKEGVKQSARVDSCRESESARESGKLSMSRASAGSDSNESSCSSIGYGGSKPHKANDTRWEGIQAIRVRDGALGLSHFKLLKRLGCGDIGSVYLAELRGSRSHFAMKVMDKGSLASRKKLLRAQTEREILQLLDHPFLPTLYTHFESEKFLCLVMEFCSGGDLHTLRQRQPGKYFSEQAARFYAAEVLLALEYLHMMGVVYRDLKPENVLVREDGHIMLSDFDLSLKCMVSPTLVKSTAHDSGDGRASGGYCIQPACAEPSCAGGFQGCAHPAQISCVTSSCFVVKSSFPSLFPSFTKKKKDDKISKPSSGKSKSKSKSEGGHMVSPLPELIAEPTGARSMSFVGTHEYLAPEIIRGDGHGSAVDWWTFGIFLYELLFGKTPFKGSGNRATLFNVVGQPLKFPESAVGQVSFAARDLIRGLLVKEPAHRLASKRGAGEIKAHPFFEGVNWALIRCTAPPEVPRPFEPGASLSSSSTLSADKSVSKGAKVAAGQDTLSTSSNSVPVHSESSPKAGEKSNSNRSATTKSTPSSGGSYLDFDFF